MSVINYFFEKHIEICKRELENFENNKFKEVREDLKSEANQYINGAKNFFDTIDAENYSDFNKFNGMIKTLNDELNRIMKASANISTLVYVIQNVSEDDFYTYTDFISYFAYDENKFYNASERDIKQLKRFDKLIEKTEDDFEVYKERGDLIAELGLYDAAVDDYKKALELNPNYKEAEKALEEINKKLSSYKYSEKYYEEGANYFKEKKYEKAVQSFNKAIELDPNSSYAYNCRGSAKNNLGQYEEAVKDYNKAIELDPNSSYAYLGRGSAKKNLEQYFEAIKDYNKAIELYPHYSMAYNNRGNTKIILGEYQEAIEDFDKAIELNSNDSFAYNNRGNTKIILGEYQEAIEDFDKAIDLDANNSNAYFGRGLAKENLDQHFEAIKDYNKAIELDPNNEYAKNNIKNIQDQHGLK